MGRKIFVSYKYSDWQVQDLPENWLETTARHYVNRLIGVLEAQDHIYKGEDDGQSLAEFRESTIASKLREKIFDSTITIVLISKGMKALFELDENQWIPWEVAYSVRQKTQEGRASTPNALLGVALPDITGSYSYIIEDEACPWCNCRKINTNFLFFILKNNTFNIKTPILMDCENHILGGRVYEGNASYMPIIKWHDFMADIDTHIDNALAIRDAANDYDICRKIT